MNVRVLSLEKAWMLNLSRVLHRTNQARFTLAIHGGTEFQLYLVSTGQLTLETGSHRQNVGEGELAFVAPGQSMTLHGSDHLTLFHCHFGFQGAQTQEITTPLEEWASLVALGPNAGSQFEYSFYVPDVVKLKQRNKAVEFLSCIQGWQYSTKPARNLAAQSTFLLFLQFISEQVVESLAASSNAIPRQGYLHVMKAVQLVESGLSSPLTPGQVADQLRLNSDYLNRLFQEYFHQSLSTYIRQRRISIAKELLLSSNMNVAEVAAKVGFRDPLHFSRVFRREVGVPPRAYVLQQHAVYSG